MGVRFSIEEAENKGWITPAQAEEQRNKTKEKARQKLPVVPCEASNGEAKARNPPRTVCSIGGDLPQEKLWVACVKRWPNLKKENVLCWEKTKVIPGRRFSIDITFNDLRLAVEVDGYQNHGFHLKDFKRDRVKDRLLVLAGWTVVRYFTGEIFEDVDSIVSEIEQIHSVINNQRKGCERG